jgi:thiosulfate/3-mercaptopyruvate sulfurtransferase
VQGPLIVPDALAQALSDENCVVIDCRFDLLDPSAGRQAYETAHIPGARYADLDRDLARAPAAGEGRHPLPRTEDFLATLGRWGIAADSFVVAYDAHGGAIAARLWWMLRWVGHRSVAVLDGGLPAWTARGHPLESSIPHVEPRTYSAEAVHDDWIVSTADLESGNAGSITLIDARSAARFLGHEDPIDPVAGHVPSAVNLPFSECLAADGRFLEPSELAALIASRLPAKPARLVAMCGSGVTACHLLLALELAGVGSANRLYVGSWSEWIRDPARPVVTPHAG